MADRPRSNFETQWHRADAMMYHIMLHHFYAEPETAKQLAERLKQEFMEQKIQEALRG